MKLVARLVNFFLSTCLNSFMSIQCPNLVSNHTHSTKNNVYGQYQVWIDKTMSKEFQIVTGLKPRDAISPSAM